MSKEPPFDCPHCGHQILELGEVATVGSLNGYPHATCPGCRACMGCEPVYIKGTPELAKALQEAPDAGIVPLVMGIDHQFSISLDVCEKRGVGVFRKIEE